VARGTVKARAIARDRRVGAMVRLGDRAVVVRGRARLVDPLTLRGMRSLVDLPFAATGFLGRNLRDTAGVIAARPAPTLPVSRVGVALDVSAGMLLDGDDLILQWGTWPAGDPPSGDEARHPLPDNVRMKPGTPVTVGWDSSAGPIALPARWRGDHAQASAAALGLAGVSAPGPACITAARSGSRLDSKRGVLISGEGFADAGGAVAIDPRRVTWWRGDEVRSAALTSRA
jgi:hypothetical protein